MFGNNINSQEARPGSSFSGSSYTPPPAYQWGTQVMGTPAGPTSHPNNQEAAASWSAGSHPEYHHYPYLQHTPVQKPATSPLDTVAQKFNSWSSKAEITANNIWKNLKTGSSVSGSAWGKVNLTAKALTEGGFEPLYKQAFATFPNEKLKKTFACYLSTSTGPIAGTLYLSNIHLAFSSDRPLPFAVTSGQETWGYYKVMVPLAKVGTINRVSQNQSEKYIQVVTMDGHDFWFMGFVNYEKASRHLLESIPSFAPAGVPVHIIT